jgi:phosphate transport system substrate-binding protein
MKSKKKILGLFLALIFTFALAPSALAADAISIVIDGEAVISDTAPVVENKTTLVPLRVITEYLGAEVSWNEASRRATVKTAAHTLVFAAGSASYTVNGKELSLSTAAKIVNSRMMIPLRALSESIGAKVDYDPSAHAVVVDYFTGISGSIKISGSTTVQPIAQAAADRLLAANAGLTVSVAGGGSGAGIKETIAGANDIGMSSRELTADEASTLSVFSIANDGIAIIAHPRNPVKNLTREQAKDIFLGNITNWKDVGGNDAPILVQTRETGSGTLATLEELLLDKSKVTESATPYTSTSLLRQAVAASENAVGFISIGYLDSTVKALTIDYIAPTEETITDGSYALSRSLYVFTKGAPSGANARFIDFLRSASVQEDIVKKEGYIGIR